MRVRALLLASVFVASAFLNIACRDNDQNVTSPTPPDSPSDSAGSSPPAPPTVRTCDATKAQFAVGNRASDALLERARVAAEASVARFLRPNEPITMEYLASRLNLNLNERGVVVSTRCG